jgi:hypothetical protein
MFCYRLNLHFKLLKKLLLFSALLQITQECGLSRSPNHFSPDLLPIVHISRASAQNNERAEVPVQGALPGSAPGGRTAQRLQAHGSCERSTAGAENAQREVYIFWMFTVLFTTPRFHPRLVKHRSSRVLQHPSKQVFWNMRENI